MGQIYLGSFTHYCVCEILDPRAWAKYTLGHSPIIAYVKLWTPTAWAKYTLSHTPIIVHVKFWTPELGSNIPWIIHPSLSMLNFGPPELWPNIPWAIHPLLFMLNFRSHGLGQIYTGPFTQYCLCQTLEHRYWVKYTLRHSPIFVYVKHWTLELVPIIPWAIHPLLFMLNIGPQGLVQIYPETFIHFCLC